MKLYPHQMQVLEQTKDLSRVAYYLDMGLGKTFVGSEKMMSLDARVNLIICQKSKVNDWIKHFFTFYIDKSKCDESGAWCYDLTKSDGIEMFEHSRYRVRIGVINYDLIFRRMQLLKLKDFTLMLDESSLIQNVKAKRTKAILKMQPRNVILLSGTPTSGKYENLWTQCHLLGWDITDELYQKQYINWTNIEVGGAVHKIVDKDDPYKNVERLKRKIRSHGAVFLKTEECFDLPQQIFTDVTVESSKEYKRFVKSHIVTVEDTDVVGDTTLTQMLGERELCGMYSSAKLQAFADILDSTSDRLIVFYNFDKELAKLIAVAEEHERPISQVNGHVKDLKAYEDEADSVTFIQYQAGAMGLNLQKADKIVYFTLPLQSELFEQSKKRIHRIGQTRTCFYYLMICKGSIEEKIKQTLVLRRDFTDELFRETQT